MQSSVCSEREFPEAVRPWESLPFQLVSWWDMQKFAAEKFVTIGTAIQQLKEELGLPGVQGDAPSDISNTIAMTPERRGKVQSALKMLVEECSKIDLRVTLGTLEQIEGDFLSVAALPKLYAIGRIAGLEGTLRTEMQNSLFLFIPSERSRYYAEPLKEWEPVLSRFPRVRVDIEESSRCFACDRYAGAIFHVLLVAEFGVIEVAKLLGAEGDKPGWGALERLERIRATKNTERSDREKSHSQLLEQVLPLMVAIKDAWRHKISHVENKLVWMDTDFSPQIAEEVILTTRGFMRRLAADLPR